MKRTIFLILLLYTFILSACSLSEKNDTGENTEGQGGSLARFTVIGNYLYTVDVSRLHTFSLADKSLPVQVDEDYLDIYTETIFPYQNSLLLGADNGMYVYSLDSPENPEYQSYFVHFAACDPVVAENGYAYITLNSANQRCFRAQNLLQIVDIHDLSSPQYKSGFDMISPLGLDIHNDTLFVCDNGLKVLDVSDKLLPKIIRHFDDIQAKDVIYNQGILIVIGNQGLFQYRIQGNTIENISTLPVVP